MAQFVRSPLKKPPGEGTGPTRHADLRENLVGRVPPRGEPDVFQQAVRRHRCCAMLKTLSLIGYIGMVGGLLGLLAMHAIFSPSAWVIVIQVAALLLGVWARVSFGRRSYHVAANPTEGCLVTWGPYRYIRHPIYTAICVATLAGVGAHWSWKTGACGAVVAGSLGMRIFCEERLLVARYPEYGQYAARTWRMIPYVY